MSILVWLPSVLKLGFPGQHKRDLVFLENWVRRGPRDTHTPQLAHEVVR
ncbi:MAG TPA: hypothetical protein VN442_01210 [Bryobacteraceae bacterium]|nr:hypothetical protein [Bryobacteraceae bacterium]